MRFEACCSAIALSNSRSRLVVHPAATSLTSGDGLRNTIDGWRDLGLRRLLVTWLLVRLKRGHVLFASRTGRDRCPARGRKGTIRIHVGDARPAQVRFGTFCVRGVRNLRVGGGGVILFSSGDACASSFRSLTLLPRQPLMRRPTIVLNGNMQTKRATGADVAIAPAQGQVALGAEFLQFQAAHRAMCQHRVSESTPIAPFLQPE